MSYEGVAPVSFGFQGQPSRYDTEKSYMDRAIASGQAVPQGDEFVLTNIGATVHEKDDGTIVIQGSKQGSEPEVLHPETSTATLGASQTEGTPTTFWDRYKTNAQQSWNRGPFKGNPALNFVNRMNTAGIQSIADLASAASGKPAPQYVDAGLLPLVALDNLKKS